MPLQKCPPKGALGLNYNGKLTWIDHDEIRHMGATWIRGFLDMHSPECEQDRNLAALLGAADAGFGTVLSLKWDYAARDFPAPGSPEFAAELRALDRVLRAVVGRVDILVVGNEPFIEAKPAQAADGRLNVFYEALAEATINFCSAAAAEATTRLYMGALNRLDLPARRTPAVERMLRFIASRRELDGVDLHPHTPTGAGQGAMVNWALERLRPDQEFLATEFSLVWQWKRHMGDAASAEHRTRHGLRDGTRVWEVIDAAVREPVPPARWRHFLAHEPWFAEHRGFLAETVRLYRATGRLAVATYPYCPMRDRKQPFGPDDTPWLLNGVYAPSTVSHEPGGPRPEGFPWAEEFRRVVNCEGETVRDP